MAKPTLTEFRQEILAHRHRVLENGVLITRYFKTDLPALSQLRPEQSETLVRFYLDLHDEPKSMDLANLRKIGYTGEHPLYEELYKIYGLDLQSHPPAAINELNRLENELKLKNLKAYLKNSSPEEFEALLKDLHWIEMISDITDTKIYRGLELGFTPIKYSTDQYFLMKRDYKAARISHWLEMNYHSKRLLCSQVFF